MGGKGAALARLVAAGLPVPPIRLVPCALLGRALDAAGLRGDVARGLRGDAAARAEAAARLGGLGVPDAAALVAAARALGGPVAVRSSARVEDRADGSAAGAFHSEVVARAEDVPDAVRRVWASLASPAAAVAARRADADAMGVVLQAAIAPRAAGVVFTTHPVTGSARELVVEAVWGHGETLVGGGVVPQHVVLRRPRRSLVGGRGILPEAAPWVVDTDPIAQPVALRLRRGRLVPEARAGRRAAVPPLTDPEAVRVAALALRTEAVFGRAQDVEWVIDGVGVPWIVQARPIVARPAPRPRHDALWTRRFVGERWTVPPTTLGWSLVAPALAHHIAYPETQARYLGGGPPLRRVEGWPYVDVTVFRHLAFKTPGGWIPGFVLELLPPEEAAAWRDGPARAPDLPVVARLLRETIRERRWERFAWDPLENHRAWRRFVARSGGRLRALERPTLGPRDAVRRLDAAAALLRDYVGIHVVSLLLAHLAREALRAALGPIPDGAALAEALGASPPGNATVQAHAALHALAHRASEDDLDALAEGRVVEPFGASLRVFLAGHGRRSFASWEVFAPRWGDDLPGLAALLRTHRVPGLDPAREVAAREAAWRDARERVRRAVPTGRAALVLGVAWYARRYTLLRENQRAWFDGWSWATREAARGLGRHLVDAGRLAAVDDVAHLAHDELEGVATGALDDLDLDRLVVGRRAARQAAWSARPPVFLGVTPPEVVAPGRAPEGQGVSGGRGRGPVRVLRRPEDLARVRPGDVVVARALDPAWTGVMVHAAAVVTELGGALSHAAVVAREYGVPMVVGVGDAVRRLPEGDEVTVDGARGRVWVHGGHGALGDLPVG